MGKLEELLTALTETIQSQTHLDRVIADVLVETVAWATRIDGEVRDLHDRVAALEGRP